MIAVADLVLDVCQSIGCIVLWWTFIRLGFIPLLFLSQLFPPSQLEPRRQLLVAQVNPELVTALQVLGVLVQQPAGEKNRCLQNYQMLCGCSRITSSPRWLPFWPRAPPPAFPCWCTSGSRRTFSAGGERSAGGGSESWNWALDLRVKDRRVIYIFWRLLS